ncbi:MAG: NADH-quinone oxidoreductase subunit C [Candidatus Tokpelaia sp. JSC161]|jgi:NADH-quinone oxidoreductase subunit C|nr:MAG: NADH-quinone oxidoreductase subunit C [Candidatus Tokpelaia sp. JSC161]
MVIQALNELADYLNERLDHLITNVKFVYDEMTISIAQSTIVDVLVFLRDDRRCGFVSLTDITAVDYPAREKRFDVCYQILSPYQNLRLRVKLITDELIPVPSVCSVYAGAEWYEREVYDMYGVRFSSHPDLRRILTDYGFDGYPLRKDFPVSGFVECRYDSEVKRVVYEPVVLEQEIRNFDFISPWEGFVHRIGDKAEK